MRDDAEHEVRRLMAETVMTEAQARAHVARVKAVQLVRDRDRAIAYDRAYTQYVATRLADKASRRGWGRR